MKNCISKNGFSPSIGELAEHFRISNMAVRQHLLLIEKKGYIERVGNRAIKILKEPVKE